MGRRLGFDGTFVPGILLPRDLNFSSDVLTLARWTRCVFILIQTEETLVYTLCPRTVYPGCKAVRQSLVPQYQDEVWSFDSSASRRTLEGLAGFMASHATFPFSQILLRLAWVLWTCLLTILSGRGFSALPLLIEYLLYRLTPLGAQVENLPASLGIRRLHCSGFLHRTDALTS